MEKKSPNNLKNNIIYMKKPRNHVHCISRIASRAKKRQELQLKEHYCCNIATD